MKYQVLVPTHHKTNNECFDLVKYLNISSSCLISNQCNGETDINKEEISIYNSKLIGVSNNRNNLLKLCSGDICICIDDDCPLVTNYLDVIQHEFDKFPDAEFILFNGVVTHENNRLVHKKNTARVKQFQDVSYAGGPGLVFKREAIAKYNLKYNTKVGFPNDICMGEDSLFIKSIVDCGANFIRSSEVLFVVKDDVDNSSYFNGVTEQFVKSKGCIVKALYPQKFWFLKYHYAYRLKNWRNNKFSFIKLVKLLKEGSKLVDKII